MVSNESGGNGYGDITSCLDAIMVWPPRLRPVFRLDTCKTDADAIFLKQSKMLLLDARARLDNGEMNIEIVAESWL